MFLNKYLPEYHFSEKHSILIAAPAEKIFGSVNHFDLRNSRIIRFLFWLRGLPSEMSEKENLGRNKFIELDKRYPEEIVIGLIGQFWKPAGNLQTFNPEDFTGFAQQGFLKAVWNFQLTRQTDSLTLLTTETRILALSDAAKKKFSVYWFFIRPFSGLIRKEMLRSIRKQAESFSAINA